MITTNGESQNDSTCGVKGHDCKAHTSYMQACYQVASTHLWWSRYWITSRRGTTMVDAYATWSLSSSLCRCQRPSTWIEMLAALQPVRYVHSKKWTALDMGQNRVIQAYKQGKQGLKSWRVCARTGVSLSHEVSMLLTDLPKSSSELLCTEIDG